MGMSIILLVLEKVLPIVAPWALTLKIISGAIIYIIMLVIFREENALQVLKEAKQIVFKGGM